jgi:hypothetical protein
MRRPIGHAWACFECSANRAMPQKLVTVGALRGRFLSQIDGAGPCRSRHLTVSDTGAEGKASSHTHAPMQAAPLMRVREV